MNDRDTKPDNVLLTLCHVVPHEGRIAFPTEEECARLAGKVDHMLFSGLGGVSAAALFDQIAAHRRTLQVSADGLRIHVVPGPLDVERPRDRGADRLVAALREAREPLDDVLLDHNDLARFHSFFARYHRRVATLTRAPEPVDGALPPLFSRARLGPEGQVSLLSLNTALAALGDPKEDQGRLVLGTKQVTREDLADPSTVVLSYHPLDRGWFLDEGVALPFKLGMRTRALCLAADPRGTTPTTTFYQIVQRESGPRWTGA